MWWGRLLLRLGISGWSGYGGDCKVYWIEVVKEICTLEVGVDGTRKHLKIAP